jgi:hypothetical protein
MLWSAVLLRRGPLFRAWHRAIRERSRHAMRGIMYNAGTSRYGYGISWYAAWDLALRSSADTGGSGFRQAAADLTCGRTISIPAVGFPPAVNATSIRPTRVGEIFLTDWTSQARRAPRLAERSFKLTSLHLVNAKTAPQTSPRAVPRPR